MVAITRTHRNKSKQSGNSFALWPGKLHGDLTVGNCGQVILGSHLKSSTMIQSLLTVVLR